MKANIPVFRDVPPDLKVMLVDVPGLGDGNLSITQVAIESAKISSAYIYLIDYMKTDDICDIEGLGTLYKMDKGLCDHNYELCLI